MFVVGKPGTGKTKLLNSFADMNSLKVLNLNLLLSEALLNLSEKQRSLHLYQILSDIIRNEESDTIILDNTELLFDKVLKLNPIELLLQVSRNKNIVFSWNGEVKNGKLLYAENWHDEYQQYSAKGTLVLEI